MSNVLFELKNFATGVISFVDAVEQAEDKGKVMEEHKKFFSNAPINTEYLRGVYRAYYTAIGRIKND